MVIWRHCKHTLLHGIDLATYRTIICFLLSLYSCGATIVSCGCNFYCELVCGPYWLYCLQVPIWMCYRLQGRWVVCIWGRQVHSQFVARLTVVMASGCFAIVLASLADVFAFVPNVASIGRVPSANRTLQHIRVICFCGVAHAGASCVCCPLPGLVHVTFR